MTRLLIAALLLLPSLALAQTGVVSGASVTATGSTASRTLADRFAQVVNVKDFGAKGDGTTDDSASINLAIAHVNALLKNGVGGSPVALYLPAGIYYISANTLTSFAQNTNGSVLGDGPHKSYIKVGTSYSGDVFSWSDAWFGNDYNGTSLNPANDKAGPTVFGVTITGDTTATNTQNALMFYDRADDILLENVSIFFLHGSCLTVGKEKNDPVAFARESKAINFRCHWAGTSSVPAMEFDTNGTGDSTNQWQLFGIDIFAPSSTGLLIHNSSNTSKGTGGFRFYGLRAEGSLSPVGTGDLVQIGSASDNVASVEPTGIEIYGFESNASYSGHNALGFYGQPLSAGTAEQPHFISVFGNIATGGGNGINIQQGYDIDIHMPNLQVTGTDLIIGNSSNVTREIFIDAYGRESQLSTSIDSTSQQSIFWPGSKSTGQPAANSENIVANQRGQSNTSSGTNNTISGGLLNGTSNNGNTIGGGQNNQLSGQFSTIPGGIRANDRSAYGALCHASGDFAQVGDAQVCEYVLRASATSTGAVTLTEDGNASSSTNCVNLPTGTGYSLLIDVEAFDHTTTGNNESWGGWYGKMYRPSTPASVVVSMGTTPTPLTSGTVTGSSVSATADTTNGCLALSFTPPTSNTDTWRVVARVRTVQVQ